MKTYYNNIKKQVYAIAIVATMIVTIGTLNSCNSDECEFVELKGCQTGVDVAFLVDYTGSMGGAIESIKAQVSTIVQTIATQSNGNYRLSLSIFDEMPTKQATTYANSAPYLALPAAQKIINTSNALFSQHLTMLEPFAPVNETSFTNQLGQLLTNMPIGGGMGTPEPGDLLLKEILSNNFAGAWRTGNVKKIVILITDAPAGGDDDLANATDDAALASLASIANGMGVQCVLISAIDNSNYKLSLINNNTNGLTYVTPEFKGVSDEIVNAIKASCGE